MRYVLITGIPFALTPDGEFAVDILWGWDLDAHLKAFRDLHIFAPMNLYDQGKFPYTFPKDSINFHSLPSSRNPLQFLMKLPNIIYIYSKYFQKDDIIHSTGTAYPPFGLIANIFCLFKGYKKRIIVFDADLISDLGLLIKSDKASFKKIFYFLIKNFYSFIFLVSIIYSPLTLVVGETLYERYKSYGNVVKIYASWVRKMDIISSIRLKEKIECISTRKEIRLCFAASLIPKKNPVCAVETARILKQMNVYFTLHIFGEGPLKRELEELVKKYDLYDYIAFKGLIPYGDPFYNILRKYDAILIPNLSGEQPRIIFDAMANGVVVVGSNLRSFSIISNDNNGLLCNPYDIQSFALAVGKLYKDKSILVKMICAGIKTARENTIESIHKKRMQIILKAIQEK